jgi:hypothetical protein
VYQRVCACAQQAFEVITACVLNGGTSDTPEKVTKLIVDAFAEDCVLKLHIAQLKENEVPTVKDKNWLVRLNHQYFVPYKWTMTCICAASIAAVSRLCSRSTAV